MKQKTEWNKGELTHLYWDEDKTLQEIGDLFGVTRERVKQVMERFSIPRKKSWAHQRHRHHGRHERDGGRGLALPRMRSACPHEALASAPPIQRR